MGIHRGGGGEYTGWEGGGVHRVGGKASTLKLRSRTPTVYKILCRLDKTYNDECNCDCFYLGNNSFLMRNSTYKSGKIVCVSRNRKNHFIS